jgi:type III secretion system FlhB-like substrate exporter
MSEEEKALEIANTIIKSLENIKEENNKAVSSYYRLLSSLQNRCGDYKNAMDNINKAIVMDENNHSNYCVMGDIFINEYEFENAENALKKSLEKSIKNIGEDSPHTASIYLYYSNFYWQTKQENKCLEYAEKAYEMMKKHLGEENLYTARCSVHWGGYLYHKGQYKKAFEKMEKPAKIIATIFGKENKELIYLNMNLGKILIQLNNYDDLLIFDKYLKGEIYYNFNDTPFENIIKRMCLLVVRKNEKNEYAVGLAYEYDKPRAPKIILKSKNVKGIISCCKKNDIAVELDKSLALALYEDGEIEQIVPSKYWEYIAKIFVKIMKKDK